MNSLVIASAGAGKTSLLVDEAYKHSDSSVLITTYTQANEHEIKNKFFNKYGCVPGNVTIQTWFSFLISEGVKPYQGVLFENNINGLMFVNKKSGYRFKNKWNKPIFWGEKDFYKYYFTTTGKVYSDKLSKLVIRVCQKSNEKNIKRISLIYNYILIDEVQDLAGYDLDIVCKIAKSKPCLKMVCDPRQVTYLTHLEARHKKYRGGNIEKFIKEECKQANFNIDHTTLSGSYRCNEYICRYSNRLYPDMPEAISKITVVTGHDGVFLITRDKVEEYLNKYNPVQLRWDAKNKAVNTRYPFYNFGEAKGLTFDRILIYPTDNILKWMRNHEFKLSDQARAKFYVALTRARYSVAIIVPKPNEIKKNNEVFEY